MYIFWRTGDSKLAFIWDSKIDQNLSQNQSHKASKCSSILGSIFGAFWLHLGPVVGPMFGRVAGLQPPLAPPDPFLFPLAAFWPPKPYPLALQDPKWSPKELPKPSTWTLKDFQTRSKQALPMPLTPMPRPDRMGWSIFNKEMRLPQMLHTPKCKWPRKRGPGV